MRPIVRIINVKANGDKIELTKDQLYVYIKQQGDLSNEANN